VTPLAQLAWDDGVLRTSVPGLPPLAWTRPAKLAEARLALVSPPATLELATGADLLTAAFAVLPFACEPLPEPVFGDAVTSAARTAFACFMGVGGSDDFRVLRGEPDDFLVCARRAGSTWTVSAFCVSATTLTVRFEDLWAQTPADLRAYDYRVAVMRDPHAKDAPESQSAGVVRETLQGVAPDARICLDIARDGGFTMTCSPSSEASL